VSRAAVLDMRRLLQVLRQPVGNPLERLEPLPGAPALSALAADMQRSGVRVHLTVADQVADLPPVLQLTVVRVVQEALTNVRKHAAATACWVEVQVRGAAVEVAVDDDGTGCRRRCPVTA
jgi:signal transduction histidine kinase